MRFAYTEEQEELRSAVRGFLRANFDSPALRRAVEPDAPHDEALWSKLAEQLGLFGLAVPEEHGGSGASFVELSVALEEAGASLLTVPFFASAVLAATAVQQSGDEAAQSRILPEIAAGEAIGTLAYRDGDETPATARRAGDGWSISGTKRLVVDGDLATVILVTAQTDAGISLFAVDGSAQGLTRTRQETLDHTRRLADLDFTDVAAELIGTEGDASRVLARTLDIASVALAAEMLGVAQRALEMTVDYSKTRVQFDRPIGSFQAIKHKSADMFVDVETSRALVMHAAWAVSVDSAEVPELARLTLAHVSDACFRVTAQMLQILGGIGYTWEHDAHFYFKRAKSSGLLLGSSREHRTAVAAFLGM